MTRFPHANLARWYDKTKRDLPWRKNQDPYRVWISEIMLQQTQVDNVIPYYERFIKRFPTLRALAASDEQTVLALWTGLGYYSRARNLLKSAKQIAQTLKGKFPDTFDGLLELPGIGLYTAGAIASIAYDQPAMIFDGNVRRVLSRIFLSRDDKALMRKSLDIVTEAHASGIKPSVFNQALMELGALICSPANPQCQVCPAKKNCGARISGVQSEYPKKLASAKSVRQFYALAILSPPRENARFMVMPRSHEKGWMKGLWEFPMVQVSESPGDLPAKEISQRFKERHKIAAQINKRIGELKHSITHHQLRISVYAGTAQNLPKGAKWVNRNDLPKLSASSMLSKSLALLGRIL